MRAAGTRGAAAAAHRAELLEVLLRCDGCERWVTERVTQYGDGSKVVNWQAPPDKGRCALLDVNTAKDFGCVSFEATVGGSVLYAQKSGAPWQHFTMGQCPDCSGKGFRAENDRLCHRCAGTGNVRYYDDGYIGEEQTRLHPKERERAGPPRCPHCEKTIDLVWRACPMCGTRLNPVMPTQVVEGLGNQSVEFKTNGACT